LGFIYVVGTTSGFCPPYVKPLPHRRRPLARGEFGGAWARAVWHGVSSSPESPFLWVLSFGDAKESTPPPRGKRHAITPRSGTQNKKVGRNTVTACGQPFILSCDHIAGLESASRMIVTAGSARLTGRGRIAAPFHPPSPPRSAKHRQKAHRKALPNSPYANGSGLKQIGSLKPCGRLFTGAPQGGMRRNTRLAAVT